MPSMPALLSVTKNDRMSHMKKIVISTIVALGAFSSLLAAEIRTSPIGYWKTIDDATGEAKSIVRVYEHEGKVYGRVMKVLTDPTAKAKIAGSPAIEGLDIIKDLKPAKNGKLEGGKVLDPKNGRTYSCQIWLEDGKLVMRGSLLGIGRKQTWLAVDPIEGAPEVLVPAPKF